ncbi:MAG TPA: glutathione binding-like protein, partial [Geminicoccaceae bacterium]
PTLGLDSGEILTENAVINQYIADQAPESGLLPPAGTMERYRALEWLTFITTELHKGFAPLFKPNTPDDYKPIVKENLAARFANVDRHLADGRAYLTGDTFTAPDAYLFVMLAWADRMALDLSKLASLKAYHERVAARPKVQEALRAEGLA